jgi:hypothetical protein
LTFGVVDLVFDRKARILDAIARIAIAIGLLARRRRRHIDK